MKYSIKIPIITNVQRIKFNYFFVQIKINGGIIDWLTTEIGVQDKDWTFGLYFGDGIKNVTDKVSFKTEEDKVKFILRWM